MRVENQSKQSPVPIRLSDDGYIRIAKKDLRRILLKHLDSGLYSSTDSELSGYTEWLSETTPSISIGWDWLLVNVLNPATCKMVGQPFSNILLQDDSAADLSMSENLNLLYQHVEALDWGKEVLRGITKKYS